ncbi:MAG TPA: ABC transporter permease [Terrimesophilobacter sp.]|nr:ABC transporter permease [Terrimesophilobacter sp.]
MSPWAGPLLSLPLIIMVVVFVVTPLISMVVQSLGTGFDLSAYAAFLESNAQRRALIITFRDSLVVTLLALILGSAIAWTLHVNKNRIVQAILWTAVFIPFLMGVVIKNYAMSIILQANGVLSRIWEALPFTEGKVDLMYTPTAVVIGILYSLLPYAIMALIVAFRTIDPDLVRAAQSLGASRARALASVVLPLGAPGLLAAGGLVFMLSIGFYVTPVMLGGADSPFLASLIHRQIFIMFDNEGAAASGTILVVAAALVLAAAIAIVGTQRLKKAML